MSRACKFPARPDCVRFFHSLSSPASEYVDLECRTSLSRLAPSQPTLVVVGISHCSFMLLRHHIPVYLSEFLE